MFRCYAKFGSVEENFSPRGGNGSKFWLVWPKKLANFEAKRLQEILGQRRVELTNPGQENVEFAWIFSVQYYPNENMQAF